MYRKFGLNWFEPSSQILKNHRTENRTDSPKSVDRTELNLNRRFGSFGSRISSEPNFGITIDNDLKRHDGLHPPRRTAQSQPTQVTVFSVLQIIQTWLKHHSRYTQPFPCCVWRSIPSPYYPQQHAWGGWRVIFVVGGLVNFERYGFLGRWQQQNREVVETVAWESGEKDLRPIDRRKRTRLAITLTLFKKLYRQNNEIDN